MTLIRRVAIFAAACVFALGGALPARAALTFGPPTLISPSGRGSADPGAIALSGTTTVGIAYIQTNPDFTSRIYFRRSLDGGSSWGSPVPISGTAGQPLSVSMASYGSRFDVVWVQLAGGSTRVWYVRSTDGGASWEARKSLSPTTHYAQDARVARNSTGHVAVVWAGDRSGHPGNIQIRVSTNGGFSFGSRLAVHPAFSVSSVKPVVAFGRYGKIHLAYNEGDSVWYQRFSNGGGTATNPVEIAQDTEASESPALAARGSTAVVGYTKLVDGQAWVQVRRSTSNGWAWGSVTSLSPMAGNDARALFLSVRSGRWRALYARCLTNPCSDDAIATYLRIGTNDATGWLSPQRVSPTTHQNAFPIGADGINKTVVAWQRQDQGGSILQVWARRSN